MHRSPIPKAEPFAISTIVWRCHSLRQDLSCASLSAHILLVIASLPLEWSARRRSMNCSTRRCHPTHLLLQMCCRYICIAGRLRRSTQHEDQEQDPDRWVSRSPCGQDCWQIISQWMWNLRLELGQHLSPTAMRLMEFSPAQAAEPVAVVESAAMAEPAAAAEPAAVVPTNCATRCNE